MAIKYPQNRQQTEVRILEHEQTQHAKSQHAAKQHREVGNGDTKKPAKNLRCQQDQTRHLSALQVGGCGRGSPHEVKGPPELLVLQLHFCPLTPHCSQIIHILERHLITHTHTLSPERMFRFSDVCVKGI